RRACRVDRKGPVGDHRSGERAQRHIVGRRFWEVRVTMSRERSAGLCGVLNLNKPSGVTSRAVVNGVVRALGRVVKAGHAGTLDPLASGVLVVCVGPATRLIEYVQRQPKTYRTVVRLGARSDTLDADGTVTAVAGACDPGVEAVRAAIARQV